jgi:D-beta-D-heptose 7-phosphate kinase/D-beta-D-heptose 1-phosphate adenosyltransferase
MTELKNTPAQKSFRILLIGDNCLDVYQYGTVDRISPEAPVPIFKYSHKEQRAGMAGNVNNNLQALGCSVNYLHSETSMKTRLIDSRSKQQMIRIDDDVKATSIKFDTAIPDVYDAVVISDYDKGTVTYELMEEVISTVKCPVFIDTKKTDLQRLQGAWVKINELEYSRITSECSGLIVTKGSKGAEVIHHNLTVTAPRVEVADVTGAGDTFLSALAYCYVNTGSIEQSVQFAVHASAITVQHLGVYAPTLQEIK